MDTPRFTNESIRAILENILYTGQIAEYRRPKFSLADDLDHPENIPTAKIDGDSREILKLFQGLHEPLISLETWYLSFSVRKGKGNAPTTSTKPTRVYPLSGVARCWECFETLEKDFTLRGSTGGNDNIYYRCAYMHDQGLKRNPKTFSRIEGVNPVVHSIDADLAKQHKQLRADKIEMQVDQLMAKFIIPRSWDEWIAAYYLSDDGMAEFERAGHKHRQELQQIKDLFTAGHISGPELDQRTRALLGYLDTLKPASKPESESVVNELRPFGYLWRRLSNPEKRILLDTIFAGIYFDRDSRLIRVVAYEPFNEILDLPSDGMIDEL